MRNVIFAVVIFHSFHGCILYSGAQCEGPEWFRCDNGRCLSQFFLCDGDDDCNDFSDEKNCTQPTLVGKPDAECAADEWRCLDNTCIPEEFVCDQNHDCMDSSDELLGCTRDKPCDGFKCKNGYCILTEWKCDGTNDCADNSDEENCFHKNVTSEECTPDKGYFLCGSGECMSLKKVCDNKTDCPDGTDENVAGCKTAEQQCASGICNHSCFKTPKEAVCSCRPGYELLRNRICVDIDECAIYGICDQGCKNLEGTFNCSCDSGYSLQDDKRTCKANAGEALMVYSCKTDIRGLYLTSEVMFYIARKLQHVVGVSLDTDYVYWSNVQLGNEVIVRSKEDGSDREVIITAGLGAPEDIAVDWVTGNVYFTDGQIKHIAVCTNNGSTCTVVVNESTDKPRGISLLPSKGEMFWSDWGEKPHISKAHMDGKNITPFITKNIVWPNGLTIDYLNNRLYWVDAKLSTIETVHLDGSDRRVILHEIAKHPYSIAIFENKLYWSDWKTNSIQSCNKFTGKGHATVVKEKKPIYGIHIYHSTLKPKIPNPCIHGFCSHICLLAPNATYSCGCPADKELSVDKHSCRVTEKEKKIMVGTGHVLIQVHHEVLGKPRISSSMVAKDIQALAYDPQTGTILGSDRMRNLIFRYDPTTYETEDVITSDIGHVGGMDFDQLGRNLYWCDTVLKKIEVWSLRTGERMTLNADHLEDVPLDLAVVPEYGLLYVVFKSIDGIHIDQMQMSGHGGKTHVVETGLLGPSVSITYDAHLGRVFWADQGTGMIESTSFDGTDRHQFRSKLHAPMSLAVLGNDIFWTSYDSVRLYWADKTGNIPGDKKITLGLPQNMGTMHLVAMTGYLGPTQHPCLNNNGGCSHICLALSDKHNTCSCPNGMILDRDNKNCVSHRSCKVYEMRCGADSSCIEKTKKCNGFKDCPDGEDELDCYHPTVCKTDEYACKSGECIHNSQLCDSNYDCADRSDEEDCSRKPCEADQFQCRRGNCVSKYSVCDGRADCIDGSDEENCKDHTCDPKLSFACKSGGCIPKFWECDGQVDCDDGSDEYGQCAATTCSPKMFTCKNSRCIDTLLVCNLIDDCGDGSDELECSKSGEDVQAACGDDEYRCMQSNKCISVDARCDKVEDCPMKDDELSCTECEAGEFTCANKRCIPRAWVCDRIDDCGDKSDEKSCESQISDNEANDGTTAHCEEYRCLTGKCIPFKNVCNKVPDCYDSSDEDGKCDTSCTATNPCNGICHKTPSGPVCGCAKGYRLQNDGVSCEDIDECKMGKCAQSCRNEIGSFTCFCFDGFLLRSDGRTCKAMGPPMEIIMATKDDIRKISQTLKSVEVIYSEPGFGVGINGVDLNVAKKMVFWTTEITGTIFQLSLETMETRNVTKIGKPRTLAVDWATNNVYFYDSESQHGIKVCNLEEQKCAHVTSIESATGVNALAVDPKHGFIFWGQTDSWSYNNPTSEIYRVSMSGKNRTSIASKNIGIVSGIAIDHSRRRLFWADQHLQLIESSDLNGKDRRVVFYSNVHRPVNLNLYEDSLFWLTPGTGQMTSCSLIEGNQTCNKIQISSSHSEEEFMILHPSRQPSVNNVCEDHKCSYMCVTSRDEIECLCQDGSTVSLTEECSNVTTLIPQFGVSNPLKTDNGYVTGVMSTLFICLALVSAYYYYQRKKMDTSKCDLSIHFQNPSFGCEPSTLPANPVMMPPGEHEYVNPVVNIRSKFTGEEISPKRTIKVKDHEEIVTSESEDGNYHPDARLIR